MQSFRKYILSRKTKNKLQNTNCICVTLKKFDSRKFDDVYGVPSQYYLMIPKHWVAHHSRWSKNPSIYNILRWVAWMMGQTNRRPSVWCSKYILFFFMISCKILCKNPFNLFTYFFYKITKIKIKSFECRKSIISIKK